MVGTMEKKAAAGNTPVPQLRFKDDNGRDFAPWVDTIVDNMADRFDNLRIPVKESDRLIGDVPYYGANGIQGYVEGHTHDGEFVLLAEDGVQNVNDYSVFYINRKVWVNNHAHVLQGKRGIMDTRFLSYALKQVNYVPYLVGGGRSKLNSDVMMKLPLVIPQSLLEQQKIANFLSALDTRIDVQSDKVTALSEQKKALMQKIFAQELRFTDETGRGFAPWVSSTVEKIAKIDKGFTPRTDVAHFWDGLLPWLAISGMNDGKYIREASKNISDAAVVNKAIVPKGTLIMSFKLSIGKLGIVETPMYTNEAICHFHWTNPEIDTEYMYYYLSTVDVKSFGSKAVKGITLNNDSLNSIVVKLPEYKEQQKIATFLSKLDERIELEQDKLDAYRDEKKAFMQRMFV